MANFVNNIFNQVELIDKPQPTPATVAPTPVEVKTVSPPLVTQRQIKLTILNGTKINGLAAKANTKLKTAGFEIETTANCPQQNYKEGVLYQIKTDLDTNTAVKDISDIYEVSLSQEIPTNLQSFVTADLDFILVLGPDNI
jgi:hypothetical protein